MIGPMPDFMGTEEWEKYKTWDENNVVCLKSGAPEWLVKAFKEWMREEDEAEAEMFRGLE